jgi:hypothetical protein
MEGQDCNAELVNAWWSDYGLGHAALALSVKKVVVATL